MVLEAGRDHEARRLVSLGFGQEQDPVFGDFGIERGAEFFPVRDQLVQGARIHHGAGQDMGADFAAFFQHAHGHFLALFRGQLLQADRGRQACRAAADDHDVVLHRFAGAVLFQDIRWLCHGLIMGRKI